MKIKFNWKKISLVVVDVALAVYLVMAITSWNKPNERDLICTKVDINIEDENVNGFLNTTEIKNLLTARKLYPLMQHRSEINSRLIEDELRSMPFIKTAQCYIAEDGRATISVTQRTPIVRVKANNGTDYYIDDAGGVLPNSKYVSDMIIVTGNVNQRYACQYITYLAQTIMADDFWRNQVEQINVLSDRSVELVPRVGDHIINIGPLPDCKDVSKRPQLIEEYVKEKFHRMEIFYRQGLTAAGWDRYSYISLEFANQVVCTKREERVESRVERVERVEESVERKEESVERKEESGESRE